MTTITFFLKFDSVFLGCRQQKKTWLPARLQAVEACSCPPAGATLASCIPVGIRIIRRDHSFLSQHRCFSFSFFLTHTILLHRILTIHTAAYIQTWIKNPDIVYSQNSTSAPRYPLVTLKEEEQRSLASNPRSLNNGRLAWTAQGKAICRWQSGVPLSAIVECGGRLMRAGWFLQGPRRQQAPQAQTLSAHSMVTWRNSQTQQSGKMKRESVQRSWCNVSFFNRHGSVLLSQ